MRGVGPGRRRGDVGTGRAGEAEGAAAGCREGGGEAARARTWDGAGGREEEARAPSGDRHGFPLFLFSGGVLVGSVLCGAEMGWERRGEENGR